MHSYTLQKKKRKTISKKETQNHIQKKKRKTTYWWHWEDNFNCCMVGPQGLHFCKSDFGRPLTDCAKFRYSRTYHTAIKIIFPMSPICGFAFLFLKSILICVWPWSYGTEHKFLVTRSLHVEDRSKDRSCFLCLSSSVIIGIITVYKIHYQKYKYNH